MDLLLHPQQEPICATESRFVLQEPITLKLREKAFTWSGDDFKITNPNTGQVYFRCHGRAFSFRQKKVLTDSEGVPIANMKDSREIFSSRDKFNIFAGDKSQVKMCKVKSIYCFLSSKMKVEFQDKITRRNRRIVLKGDWRSKRCVIYTGEPKQGGIPVAKIFRPTTGRSLLLGTDDYYLEIAAGVDIALMVMICIAFDEHKRENRRD